MNVIKVRRPRQHRNTVHILPAATRKCIRPNDFEWHGMVELFFFGSMAFISFWPVFDAMAAVIRLR